METFCDLIKPVFYGRGKHTSTVSHLGAQNEFY